uniref:Glutaredoxin-2, mitochondrial n=3 Tax=Lygus hesperus TaxID=30085 RepID=A0A0A9XNM0_LYGHE
MLTRHLSRAFSIGHATTGIAKSFRPVVSTCSNLYSMGLGSSTPVDMNGPTAQFVKDSIAQDTVVIFSKSYCPYCKMAKEVFDKVKTSFKAIELDSRDDGDEIQSVLGQITGAKTVPRVFIKGEFVGGGTDVKALYENGKLEQMLA